MATTSDTGTNFRIEPLKGAENYLAWRIQLTDILFTLDYWKYVDGTSKRPADSLPTEQAAWDKTDRKALTVIRLRITSAMMIYVLSAKTSKDAWDSLANVFNAQGSLAKVTARRKFLRYQIEEGADMEDELRKLRLLMEELQMLGSTVPDDEYSLVMLTSLPPSWDGFVSSIGTVPISADLTGRIIQEDARRKERPAPDVALPVQNNQRGDQSNRGRGGRGGSNSGPRRSKFKPGVICHYCKKEGHIKPECRSLKRDTANNAHLAEDPAEPEEVAFLAEEGSDDEPNLAEALLANDTNMWLGDTGAQSHIVRDRSLFTDYTDTPGKTITGAGVCPALGRGTVKVLFATPAGPVRIVLKDAIHAPEMPYNLVSLGRLTAAGFSYIGKGAHLHIKNAKNKVIGVGKRDAHLYRIAVEPRSTRTDANGVTTEAYAVRAAPRTWYQWHCALGHINPKQLKDLWRDKLVEGMDVDMSSPINFDCETCIQAKHSRMPFPRISTRSYTEIGELVSSDVWGPARTESLGHNRYYISFVDAASHYTVVQFMVRREKVPTHVQNFDQWIETQTRKRVMALRVDNAREYTQGTCKAYLDSRGIELQTTAPYSPSSNGVAERLNRTLVEHARAMLLAYDLPLFLWEEAVSYAAYLYNRSPTRALKGKTPYEAFYGRKPDISHIEEFGVPCWVLIPDAKQNKLTAKSERFTFVGLNDSSRAWRYYNYKTRQVLTSRNIVFGRPGEYTLPRAEGPNLEGEPGTAPPPQPKAAPQRATQFKVGNLPIAQQPVARHSPRNIQRIDYKKLNKTGRISPKHDDSPKKDDSAATGPPPDSAPVPETDQPTERPWDDDHLVTLVFAAMDPQDQPKNLQEVQRREDWPFWKEAMDKEMGQLKKMGTYTLKDLPEGRKAVGCRWVYNIKRDLQGEIQKYKARLVAQGFSQVAGQDYFDTYAPVMRLESLRIVLALGAALDMEIHQMDVVGAYLNSDLEEDIYMKQPPGYEDGTTRVFHLHKGLYGLKQAGRAWNTRLNDIMVNTLGFTRSQADACVYHRRTSSRFDIIVIHVDDMAVLARGRVQPLKDELAQHFETTDLGEINSFIGLHITRDRTARTIAIDQAHYIDTIVRRFGMQDAHPVHTPLDPGSKLAPLPDSEAPVQVPYAVAIGSLMYAAVATRPDIAYAVQTLSQFTARPSEAHWTAVKRVFRYLKATPTLGITLGGTGSLTLIGYTDADWGQSVTDRRSVSGYLFKLGDAVITWSSKKQTTVALSSMEAEYIALAHATKEAIWLRSLLTDLGLTASGATTLYCDNQSAIAFSRDNQFHARSKHIDIRHHFVRERIQAHDIEVVYCASKSNCADLLTKGLARPAHDAQLTLVNMSAR